MIARSILWNIPMPGTQIIPRKDHKQETSNKLFAWHGCGNNISKHFMR